VGHLAQEDDLQSKSGIRIGIVFNIRIEYSRNDRQHYACLLRNHQSQKRVHLGKELECQLANEDDL